MRFLADESVDKGIVDRLRADGHEALYVAEMDPGTVDETVLLLRREGGAVLLTADKDFGELVFRRRQLHVGIVLVRLFGMSAEHKATRVAEAIRQHGPELKAPSAFCPQAPFGFDAGWCEDAAWPWR